MNPGRTSRKRCLRDQLSGPQLGGRMAGVTVDDPVGEAGDPPGIARLAPGEVGFAWPPGEWCTVPDKTRGVKAAGGLTFGVVTA